MKKYMYISLVLILNWYICVRYCNKMTIFRFSASQWEMITIATLDHVTLTHIRYNNKATVDLIVVSSRAADNSNGFHKLRFGCIMSVYTFMHIRCNIYFICKFGICLYWDR